MTTKYAQLTLYSAITPDFKYREVISLELAESFIQGQLIRGTDAYTRAAELVKKCLGDNLKGIMYANISGFLGNEERALAMMEFARSMAPSEGIVDPEHIFSKDSTYYS